MFKLVKSSDELRAPEKNPFKFISKPTDVVFDYLSGKSQNFQTHLDQITPIFPYKQLLFAHFRSHIQTLIDYHEPNSFKVEYKPK